MDSIERTGLVVGAAIIANHFTYQNRINAYITQGFNYDTAKAIVDGEYARQAAIEKARPWGWFGRTCLWCWLGLASLTLWITKDGPGPSSEYLRSGLPNLKYTGGWGQFWFELCLGTGGLLLGVLCLRWQARKRRRWNARWSGQTQLVRP